MPGILEDMSKVSISLILRPLARKVWRDYFPAVDAIIFIVDVNDKDRLGESKDELDVNTSHY